MVVLTAVAGTVAAEASGSGNDVPEVAEVDVVVEVGHGLRVGSGGNLAVSTILGELEELVISVFAVVGLSLGVDPVSTRVVHAHLTLILGVSVDVVVDELSSLGNGISAGDSSENGINVATGMEGAIIWESVVVGSGYSSDGGEDEGLHI